MRREVEELFQRLERIHDRIKHRDEHERAENKEHNVYSYVSGSRTVEYNVMISDS